MKSRNKEIDKKQIREDVITSLPEFINQLTLYLNSGANLEDSLNKIVNSYSELQENSKGYFKREVANLNEIKFKTGENIIVLFFEFAKRTNVKELTRVSNIMMENRLKGSMLWKKLEDEAAYLWEERKRNVLEKMKLLDSKLAFPLAISLIALLIIAIAPAILEIT